MVCSDQPSKRRWPLSQLAGGASTFFGQVRESDVLGGGTTRRCRREGGEVVVLSHGDILERSRGIVEPEEEGDEYNGVERDPETLGLENVFHL